MRQSSRGVALLAAVVMLVGVTGCGSTNLGGETTCKDYLAMSGDEQREVIKKYFSDKGRDSVPNGELLLTRASAVGYCKTMGSDDSPIKNIEEYRGLAVTGLYSRRSAGANHA